MSDLRRLTGHPRLPLIHCREGESALNVGHGVFFFFLLNYVMNQYDTENITGRKLLLKILAVEMVTFGGMLHTNMHLKMPYFVQ